MLAQLYIENLAVIESATVDFGPGLNVLTGETGAGKSIVVGGLQLVLGERASAEAIRPDQSRALVEAVFAAPLPGQLAEVLNDELEVEWDPAEPLSVRREISRSGRNRCFVNEQMVAVADLKRMGQWLVDLHGQHEHQSLLHASAHRLALDEFAGHHQLVAACGASWQEVAALQRRKNELDRAAQDFEQRLDYLTYQIAEIEQLAPEPGEMEHLGQEEKRLASAEQLSSAAAEAYALLYEADDPEQPLLLSLFGEVERRVREIARIEADAFDPISEELLDMRTRLQELAFSLRSYADRVEANPERLSWVLERREALRTLVRKHGGSEEKLMDALRTMREERDRMRQDHTERQEIGRKLAAAREHLDAAARRLSLSRRKAAKSLQQKMADLLHQLHMEKARFEVQIEPLPQPGAEGADQVEFLLAANPGLPPAPLRRIASGGELSRVMLALKSTLAAGEAVQTLVFDEIDAGVSGETVRRVAGLMEQLSAVYQVICITHHAAIAARARRHAAVCKQTRENQTTTGVVPLEGEPRVKELARLMGGDRAGRSARELARELMQ